MESQQDALTITEGDGLALLHQVIGQAVDTSLGKHFTTGLAGVLVSIARVLQLRTPVEELEDELVRFAAHCDGVLIRVSEVLHASIVMSNTVPH